jgi:protein HIRA/HIR1
MKLLKPDWVSHEGNPIFSVAIHPDGSRFATGGQGKDSGVVVIWNMAPVRSAADEANSDIPKVLCELSNHLGCVNCVRWSVDGKWLASGGDDAIVMIWAVKYQGEGAANLGFGAELERWGCIHMLRGHGGDVLDLSWSPDQKYLASCSVDNSIVIWNARELPQKFAVVTGHKGLVKGITWDPVGKYLASQSDDRSVRIWRTSDWTEEKVITKPFRNCGGTTHILRLSWSPDGRYLVSAHALNNDGPTAQIIERSDWKLGVDLVGHRKAIEVVSFNPHLFSDGKDSRDTNHGCIAVGSRDRSLSIWLTSLKRPLVVTHDLFVDSILDLAWSHDGYELMVCSTDGSLGYLSFSPKELGVRLPKQALDNLFLEIYGCSRASSRPELNSSSLSDILIEDPAMLRHHQQTKSVGDLKKNSSQESLKPVRQNLETKFDSAKVPTITKQTESRTKEGKRRITPVMLTSQVTSHDAAPRPFTSTPSKSSVTKPAENNPKTASDGVTAGTDGLEAQLLSPPAKPITFEPLSPKMSKSKPLVLSSGKGPKRRMESESEPLPRAKRQRKHTAMESASPQSSSKPGTPQKGSSVSTTGHSHLKRNASDCLILPFPSAQSTITVQLVCGQGGSDPLTLEVDNTRACCTVSCKRGADVQWSSSLISRGVVATGNHCIACIVSDDNTMSVFSSQSGRLLLARFSIPCPPHTVKVSGYNAMLVTADARVSVWDMQKMEIVVRNASFAHLLQDKKTLLQNCTLTNTGIPVLTLTDSTSYLYHVNMGVWVEVCHSNEHTEVGGMGAELDTTKTEIASLQKLQSAALLGSKTTAQTLSRLRDSNVKLANVSFLESQISRSLSLNSPYEYQHWCKAYVRYLVKEGMEVRLREFCMEFCRPGVEGMMVLGFQRQEMLKDFLALVAGNAKLQRLYCELRDAV